MNLDYSVIIRTTGKAGEKYAGLLASIDGLIPRPREVIVVLPEGFALPEEKLGWETFYFCPKGMVIQRMTGIQKCRTRYALVCDDDVQFGPDFVQKLHEPVENGICGISAGPLYSFLPAPGKGALVDMIMGAAIPTVFHRDRYVSVLRTTGYSYNRNLDGTKRPYYETQSVAWTCFYADVEALRGIDFETEQLWLDSHGYSALDDQTMFYKAWLRGVKTVVVTDAVYEHLDGKTSTRGNPEPFLFSSWFNRVVFWHRFIFMQETTVFGRIWSALCFGYRVLWMQIHDAVKRVPAERRRIKAEGRRAGWEYIQSEEYRLLPPVK